MRPPKIFFLIIHAVAIQALRDPVNQALTLTPQVMPPDDLQVRASSYSQKPQDTISVAISPNKTLLTYGFGNILAHIGPGVFLDDRSKYALTITTLEYRGQNASFAVATVTYRGFAILDPGVNLTVSARWYMSNYSEANSFSYTVNDTDGKENNILSFRGDTNVPLERRVYTPCSAVGKFTMNVYARLESANATGTGYMLNEDQFMVQVGLDWRQCNKSLT
jgi:hypothetical protein